MNFHEWGLPYAAIYLILFGIVLLRAGATYWLGRFIGSASLNSTRVATLARKPGFARAQDLVSSYGAPIVVFGFITIGFQTLINLASGFMKMPLPRYVPALLIGGALWALIYSTVGFVGFVAIAAAYERWPVPTVVVLAALVLAAAVYIAWRVRQRRAMA